MSIPAKSQIVNAELHLEIELHSTTKPLLGTELHQNAKLHSGVEL